MNKKKLLTCVSIVFAVVPSIVLAGNGCNLEANSVGMMAASINSNTDELVGLLKGGAYLGGLGFAISSALKFKEHNENPQQIKLSQPVTKALVAGALLSFGTWMNVLSGTTVGEDRGSDGSSKFEDVQNDPRFC